MGLYSPDTYFWLLCISTSTYTDVKQREADRVERLKVSYPKFKNGEATVRDVRISQNFGECIACTYFNEFISAL